MPTREPGGHFRAPTIPATAGCFVRLVVSRAHAGWIVDEGEHLVLPLNVSHAVKQCVEFFRRETGAKSRDTARDFMARGRDGLCFSFCFHRLLEGGSGNSASAARIYPRRRMSYIRFSRHDSSVILLTTPWSIPFGRRSFPLQDGVSLLPAVHLVAGRTLDRVHLFDGRGFECVHIHRKASVDQFPSVRALDQYSVHSFLNSA